MSDITGFFSYLKVMLWLAQDLFSNCTQTGTALVISTAGMVQVMLLSLRLRDTGAELRTQGLQPGLGTPDRQVAATDDKLVPVTWQPAVPPGC